MHLGFDTLMTIDTHGNQCRAASILVRDGGKSLFNSSYHHTPPMVTSSVVQLKFASVPCVG